MSLKFMEPEQKREQKKSVKKPEKKHFPVNHYSSSGFENVELKKLTHNDDFEDTMRILLSNGFEVSDADLKSILSDGLSFGAYVGRTLVAIGLGWRSYFDENSLEITHLADEANSLYVEDAIISLNYEGAGLRKMILRVREEEAKKKNLKYSVSHISEDLPSGRIEDYIKERGKLQTQVYLFENYSFIPTNNGHIAVKVLK